MTRRTTLTTLALLAAGALLTVAGAAPPALAQTYAITDIGRLRGSMHSHPRAMKAQANGTIMVVGNTTTSKGATYHGFYWDSATKTITDIGALSGGNSSQALAVNRSGEVVGTSTTTSSGGNGHAIYWNNTARRLTDLTPGLVSAANSIDESGVIVGSTFTQSAGTTCVYWLPQSHGTYGSPTALQSLVVDGVTYLPNAARIQTNGDITGTCQEAATGNSRAVVWKKTDTGVYGAPIDLGLPAGAVSAEAGYSNTAGQVVGWAGMAAGAWNACIWRPGLFEPTDLGSLGGGETRAGSLNVSGQVAGDSLTANGARQAMLWLPEVSLADQQAGLVAGINGLGTLGGSESSSVLFHYYNNGGQAINSQGQVVGWSRTTGNTSVRAFLWDCTTSPRMRDLNVLTPSKGNFTYIREAIGILDSGHITGIAVTKNGEWHAFLMTRQ
jgi:probable HAF family extracellular repeat protein